MHFMHKKLRDARKARNLTIKQLSEKSKVSPGMISWIERGRVNPSVDVVFKICNALELSIDYFLPTNNQTSVLSILTRKEQYLAKNESSKSYYANPMFEKLGHSVILIYLKPGCEYGRKHIIYDSDELLLVVKGSVAFFYDGKEYPLKEGSSAYFSASKLHYVVNSSPETVTLIWCLFKTG
jgi:transcriptional regulator with XRE-family HTH domain